MAVSRRRAYTNISDAIPVSLNRCCATKLLFRQICLLDFTCVPEGAGILGEDAPGRSFYRNKVHQTQKATSEDVALIALAGSTGLEPATSDVTGRRSNQTELTPQAVVRGCFRSRALRGLVYTEVCPVRNNFFENIFWAPETLPAVTMFNQFLLLAASRLGGPVLRGGVVLGSCWDSAFCSKKNGRCDLHPPFLLHLL